jgi:hypothetical protein
MMLSKKLNFWNAYNRAQVQGWKVGLHIAYSRIYSKLAQKTNVIQIRKNSTNC